MNTDHLEQQANDLIAQLNAPEQTPESEVAQAEVTETTVDTAPAPVQDDSSLRSEIEAANQRWRTLQGIVAKKDADIASLRQLIAQLNEQQAKPAPVANVGVSQEEIDNYGADLLDVVARRARQELLPELERLSRENAELRTQVGGVQQVTAMTAVQQFETDLTRKIPTWRDTNVNPQFLNWLNVADPFSGVTRLQLLQDAYTRQDLDRTARFFDTFTSETAAAPQATKPSDKLKNLVAPGKGKATTSTSEAGSTKVWTQADITALYRDQQERRITPAQFAAQEKDLFIAQAEGRVA